MSESPDACSLLSDSSLLGLMDAELIDDKEFDIPEVDTPPTLESILSEEDEEPFVLEDTCVLNTDNIDTHSCDSASLASSDSGDPAHLRWKKRTVDLNATVHGSVLRHSLLKGISAQIVSAADKVDAGLPTAVTVSGVIAVGTSHGLALVFGECYYYYYYSPLSSVLSQPIRCPPGQSVLCPLSSVLSSDTNQALRLCLGTKVTGADFGAVSALSINHDCSRLLCGFAKGQITMWDLANGKLLRTITDAHPPGTAVLHVKFTDDPTLAVCNDSGGSVFELAFRRVMGMRSCDSRCLFSGSKGEVCCIEPLLAPADLREHPLTHYCLLAMASLTKILIIGLKPSLKVWMTFPYSQSDPSSVPQLSWQFVSAQRSVNPVLAFCKGDQIQFLMIKKEEAGTIHVIKQRALQLSCDIISLSWINSRTLVLLDSHEKLQVVDRPSQETLETLDLEKVQLVYNSRHFKSLATGGNVSQALALVAEKACYQSISTYAGQIVYLGTKSAHIMTLRNWRERIDCLLKHERFPEALSLSWSFHEGTAKAVLGLFGDPQKRRSVVSDKMVEILLQFADQALKKCPEHGRIQVLEQHFQDMVPVLVDFCLLLHRTDLLFDHLYVRLSENVVAKSVFLESLESYIVVDRLGHLTTPIMKDLLTHYHGNGLMDSLERCIVHLDITSLDIQQLVQVCWENHLYDAMIYVFTSGMNDYITPMEKLFAMIGPLLREGRSLTDEDVVMGNKLLVYISCCLAGRAFPRGDIPEDLVVQVKIQVFEFLIRLHSADSSEDEPVFPFIQTILHFDTREFLNVLSMTFEDFKNDKQALEYQQRIVDILLQVMVDNPDFTPSQVGGLFTFLARQLTKPDNTLFVNRNLFDQVLDFLCRSDDDSRHTERQQVLLELLQVGGVVQFDEGRLLELAENAKFYQICEFLYEKKHMYASIVDCYLGDARRKSEIFSYIHNLMSMPGYTAEEKQDVKHKVLQHMQELIALEPSKSAELVRFHFVDEVQQIVSELQDDHLAFRFLSCLLEPREGHSSESNLLLQRDLHDHLLELLCRFAPDQLLHFLQTSERYRLEEAIQTTQTYQFNEATAYLLEKKGDVHGAFAVSLEDFKGKLRLLATPSGRDEDEEQEGGRQEDEQETEWSDSTVTRVEGSLSSIVSLCHRCSRNFDQSQRERLWFPLLEALIAAQKQVQAQTAATTARVLKEFTMNVLNNMSSFISLPAIVQQILQDPVYEKGKLAEIQGLILGTLDTFNYEQTLLETTTRLLNHDLHWSLSQLHHAVTRGLHPQQDSCNICLQPYRRQHGSAEGVVVFSCGHTYHYHCLQQQQDVSQQQWSCHKCSSHAERGGRVLLPNRGGSSLTQVCAEKSLDFQQEQSWDQLRCLYQGPSRLSILSELCHPTSEHSGIPPPVPTESCQLKLCPPPLSED